MGTIYAIANQKGGVGKTTTAVNLAACIAEAGYETLLVDLDPQCNATVALGTAQGLGAERLRLPRRRPDARRRPRSRPRSSACTIVPSTPDLAGANVELPRLPGSETRLSEALGAVRERYLLHAARLPAVARPDHGQRARRGRPRDRAGPDRVLRARGARRACSTRSALIQRELNPRLTVAGMLLTMHDGRTRLAQDVEREVREHFPELVFDTVIPRNVRIGEAPSFGLPVTRHDPRCPGSVAYLKLAKEVAARG